MIAQFAAAQHLRGQGINSTLNSDSAQSGSGDQRDEWAALQEALQALEFGDWRRALACLQADGRSHDALAVVVRLLIGAVGRLLR